MDPLDNRDNNTTPVCEDELSSRPIEILPEPEFVRELIQLQREHTLLRRQELEVEKLKTELGHEFSLRHLETITKDSEAGRTHVRSDRRDRMLFAVIVMVLLTVFLIASIRLGQAEIAKEVIKAVGLLIVGAFGGYTYGARKNESKDS